jgi:hypothetical protein
MIKAAIHRFRLRAGTIMCSSQLGIFRGLFLQAKDGETWVSFPTADAMEKL